ncbi:hypothetical protein [Motilimonas cestriensis]|uniref:hypothetical protein n=1 Tax=Motilimonas cestriensis TaxID=2742685 RepID=UPI003DA40556
MHKQNGQAMTEFAIVATLVLVPLMLLLPILGKYLHSSQKTEQAARYVAWERTVWYREIPAYATVANNKNDTAIRNELSQRLFSSASTPINSQQSANHINENDFSSLFYTHNPNTRDKTLIFEPKDNNNNPTLISSTTSSASLDSINSRLTGFVFDRLEDIGFDLNNGGLVKSSVGIDLKMLTWHKEFDPNTYANNGNSTSNYKLQAHNYILTDSWNVSGPNHQDTMVKTLTPADRIAGVAGYIQDGFNILDLLFPWLEHLSNDLELGIVENEVVPEHRLKEYR